MKPFDPDFAEMSSERLAEIDSLCSEYERKRTQGADITVESFLVESEAELRLPLRLELIQVEMEILDSWDQLDFPDPLIQRFPDQEEFIYELWQSLKTRTKIVDAVASRNETLLKATSNGSTYDDGSIQDPAPKEGNTAKLHADVAPRFRIVRNLAQGGIGTIFVAFDRDLQREVAIKELKRKFENDRAILQRFEAEATITGNLEHPNIVPIYATGKRSDGRPYYAMRLIQGRSMQTVISDLHREHSSILNFRKNVAARDLLLRFVTVCRAIGFAHSRGVLHRDLKPSNIMVGDFGETLVVDWGLALNLKHTDQNQVTTVEHADSSPSDWSKTKYGTIVGTPGYMSPEQAIGRVEEISTTSDIYSLGVTLVQILTNRIPYMHTGTSPSPENHTGFHVEYAILHGSRHVLDGFGPLPKPLEAICRKALHWDPKARYANAELLASDVEAWLLDEPVSVLKDSGPQKIRRWAKSHPATVAAGIASLLITFLAMAVTLRFLSVSNESLRQSNLREQTSAQEAVRQRQRVLGILNTFLLDVERGLANVPGSAAVQKNVLTTVLNKLGEISSDFAEDEELNLSNAKALIDLGDLFSRVGTKEIKLDLPRSKKFALSPLEAAGEVYSEALTIVTNSTSKDGTEPRRMIAMIKQKQAEILRQTARTPEALPLVQESLAMRRILLTESPKSAEAAMDVVFAVDFLGQIYLQDGDFPRAKVAFGESHAILARLSKELPSDSDIKRRLGIALSRLGDIAVHDGDLDLATQLYQQDQAIATDLYSSNPNNLTTKRDLCVSLDRIGNISAQKGQMEQALESYLESRRLREELHSAEPTSVKTSQELFVSYMKGGDTRMLLKDVTNARADYDKALALADALAEADPQNATARRFQSLSAEVLADVALEQSQLDDALQYAKRSLAISQELMDKDPANGQMQRDLYIGYAKVAKVLLAQKDFEQCIHQLNLALGIVKSAFEQQPDSLQSIGDYTFILLKRAEAYLESGDASSALKELETVIPLLETIVEANRQDAKSRRRVANATTMLGRALLAAGQPAEARQAWQRSRELTLAMLDEGMRVEQMQSDLAEIDSLISAILE